MKIAYLSPNGFLGGAETSLLDLMASIRTAKPEWKLFLVSGSDGPLVDRARSLGVPVRIVPFSPALAALGDAGTKGPEDTRATRFELITGFLCATPSLLTYIRQLRGVLNEVGPDLIHSNGFKMHILSMWSRPHGVPVVWHMHDYLRSRPIMSRVLPRYANQCGAIVTNSMSVAADVRSVCGTGVNIHTVYNTVNLKQFCPAGPTLDLDALAGLPPAEAGIVRVGLIGTLAWWKGHKTFLEAISLLPTEIPVRAYVVGGAPYQTRGSQYSLDHLRMFAAKANVSHKVGFTGFVENPAAAMRALDIVVHASNRAEPFGLVIIEAMACGRAVVVSYSGGAAEIVELGKNVLGHPPGDASALAKCIQELARRPALRAEMGKAARAAVESQFDGVHLARHFTPIYQQALLAS